jgi:hypothetical protein
MHSPEFQSIIDAIAQCLAYDDPPDTIFELLAEQGIDPESPEYQAAMDSAFAKYETRSSPQ